MKKTKWFKIICVLLFALLGCNSPNSVNNDLFKNNLSGNVRSINVRSFMAVDRFGELTKGSPVIKGYFSSHSFNYSDSYKIIYSETGNKIEENHYDSDGGLQIKTIFKYDSNDLLIEKNEYNSKGELEEKTLFEYVINSNNINKSVFSNLKYDFTMIEKYKYDENNSKIEYVLYDSDEESEISTKYTYLNEYDKYGNIKHIQTNLLEGRDYVTKKALNKFPNGWVSQLESFDIRGNRIESRHFSPVVKHSYEPNLIEEIIIEADPVTKKLFDDRNNITQLEIDKVDYYIDQYSTTSQTNILHTYQYKLDKTKNWTKKVIYENSIPKVIIQRDIEYY